MAALPLAQRDRDGLCRTLRQAIGREVRQLVRARAVARRVPAELPGRRKCRQRHRRSGRRDIRQRIAIDIGRADCKRYDAANGRGWPGGRGCQRRSAVHAHDHHVFANLGGAVGDAQAERQCTGGRCGEGRCCRSRRGERDSRRAAGLSPLVRRDCFGEVGLACAAIERHGRCQARPPDRSRRPRPEGPADRPQRAPFRRRAAR